MTRVSDEPRQGIRGWVKRHQVASFFVLAYAISWLASIPVALGYGFMFLFTQFGPALAALVVTWYSNGYPDRCVCDGSIAGPLRRASDGHHHFAWLRDRAHETADGQHLASDRCPCGLEQHYCGGLRLGDYGHRGGVVGR
jgi:hypothetical protein